MKHLDSLCDGAAKALTPMAETEGREVGGQGEIPQAGSGQEDIPGKQDQLRGTGLGITGSYAGGKGQEGRCRSLRDRTAGT